ncbi:MAG: HAMP domain-containing histidine kinase [Eubacterium sp.]|nr:HAMP domain-containing histidine kinase [Eubacterium sp.]
MKRFKLGFNFLGSIRFYIFLMVFAAGLIPSLFLTSSIMSSYENRTVSAETIRITAQSNVLANKLVSDGCFEVGDSQVYSSQIDLIASYYEGRIMLINTDYEVLYDSYGIDDEKTIVSEKVFECMQNRVVSNYDSANNYIEVCVPVTEEDDTVIGVIMVSKSSTEIYANMAYMKQNAFVMQFAIMILVVFIAIYGSGKLMKPFDVMSESIDKIQTDYENEQLSVLNYNETKQISKAFNAMLSRIKTLDDSRQEFVSNVSHELKTPLASMKVLADSLLGQEDVPIELYQEFMTDIAEEIDRENQIINDLLSLVKLDKSQGVLNITSVNVNDLMELTLKRLRPIAGEKNIEIVYETLRPVTAEIDEVKMALVFTNLVENAIKYNVDDGWVHVSLNADHQFFYVTVEDGGIGIPEEAQEHIFERFYRADKSHSREIGGTGLGLAIVRNAVLMHRGAIQVNSTEGKGSTFSLRVPLLYVQ